MHEEQGGVTRSVAWGVHGLLIAATFTAGFLSGILSDGTADVINGFKDRNAGMNRPREAAVTTKASTDTAPAVQETMVTDPVRPKPNGTIDWNLTVAPGTAITELDVDGRKLDAPMRLRFYALQRGATPRLDATLWLGSGGSGAISLPAGYYRVGSTRLGDGIAWDQRAGDENYMDGPLRIEIQDPDEKRPNLSIQKDGTMKSTASVKVRATIQPRRRPAQPKAEYEGLGGASKDGGTDTYGQDD